MSEMICRPLITAMILLFAGCSLLPDVHIKLDARLPLPPAVNQMPLHVGVYYSPEFIGCTKKFELIGCGPNGQSFRTDLFCIFPVGIASRDLFDQIIKSMFTSITRTSDLLNNKTFVDGLLELQIELFDFYTVCSTDYFSTGIFRAKVSYVINLYSPDGHLVASMHVEGRSDVKPKLCLTNCMVYYSLPAEQAMQDAMAKFMIDFYEQPEVKSWLSTHSALPGNRR